MSALRLPEAKRSTTPAVSRGIIADRLRIDLSFPTLRPYPGDELRTLDAVAPAMPVVRRGLKRRMIEIVKRGLKFAIHDLPGGHLALRACLKLVIRPGFRVAGKTTRLANRGARFMARGVTRIVERGIRMADRGTQLVDRAEAASIRLDLYLATHRPEGH